tara:strand:- start:105 stop:680 length:576 start_codon:yes stop_codon:yes gene_type:complete
MKKVFSISVTIIGVLMIIFSSLGITQELSDSDTVNAMLPPCTVEDGLPFFEDDDVTCYWGMSGEVLEIPTEAIAANVDVKISWTKSGVWIGIAEASEATKCESKGDYYECQKDSITMIAGGPNSDGELIWNPEPGEYRFVAGGEDSQTLQQFEVDWNYQASLNSSLAIILIITGLIMTTTGAMFWYRIPKS